MPSNWLVFDRIRAMTRQHRVFRSERVFQDQSQIDRLTAGGEFLDFSAQAAILDQTNLQINRMERYKDYEQMDQTGEISLALDLYADEASLIDPERKHTLVIRAKNRRLKRELEDLFYNNLRWDTQCRPCVRYLCKYGDMPFEIILDANRNAVSSLRFMNVYNFTRIETRYGDLVGFFFMDSMWPKPLFMHPWQVMHLRLTNFENLYAPYGKSILDGGRKAFKQLRLMEDAALIYRITRAPEKRKFTIPVGMIPPKEVPEYMQMIARNFKRQRFYNPSTGTFDERYSPLIQEDDFFLPRRPDGTGPDVDVLPGAENLDQIADIEYFKKKMIAPMKIPFSRVGIGEGAGEASEKSLSQSHSEFSKAVQWIQREVATGLTKVAIVHLALRGYDVEDIKGFEIALTATSAMEELYRIETWQTRTGVMADLKDLGWFPKEWIVTHFTDLSPDEIQELKEIEDDANAPSGGGGGGGGLADLGAEPEPASDEDLMAGIDVPGAEEPAAEAPEKGGEAGGGLKEGNIRGYDYAAEQRIINETAAAEKKQKMQKLLTEWNDKVSGVTGDLSSCYNHILESKELDGLSRKFVRGDLNLPDEMIYNVSIPQADREQAIKDTLGILLKDEAQ